ncbi:MAG: hypothetical protein QM747_21040 [Nocardioides sp.]
MSGHEHDHEHGHSHSDENPWAGQGAVMLDIGGDVGALVVSMPESALGQEVEIRREGSADHHHLAHVAVVPRPVADGHVPSLVYEQLAAGRYELFEKGRPDQVALRVGVVGGSVTAVAWPV